MFIYVKLWLGAGRQADLCKCCAVRGFRLRLCETLAGCRQTAGALQMLCLSGDFVYIYVKAVKGFRAHPCVRL